MVIYVDLVFLTNALADGFAFYLTSRLSALPVRRLRIICASVLGGVYGVLCLFPVFSFLGEFLGHSLMAALLTWIVFGRNRTFPRVLAVYYLLSCMLGGIFLSISQSMCNDGVSKTLQQMNWKVFFLVGGLSFFLLAVVFRGSGKHIVSGEIIRSRVVVSGRSLPLDVLWDTGHTLSDPYTGAPVLTAWYQVAEHLLEREEWEVLSRLTASGAAKCAEDLAEISPGKFYLLPYRAVGIESAMLIAFRADLVEVCGEKIQAATIALSPTPISDGGGYSALWGGERKEITSYDAKTHTCAAGITAKAGTDPS